MQTGTELQENLITGQTLTARIVAEQLWAKASKTRERETEIGKLLIQARACFDRGDFGDRAWKQVCKEDFGISDSSSWRFMREAREPGSLEQFYQNKSNAARVNVGNITTIRGALKVITRIWEAFPENRTEIVDHILGLSRPEVPTNAA